MTTPRMQQAANDDDQKLQQECSSAESATDIGTAANQGAVNLDELHEVRANLYYLACDLRSLAREAPPERATEILALSDLIASLASKRP